MILKWIGLVLMVLGSCGLGVTCYRDLQNRFEALSYISKLLDITSRELEHTRATLPQLFLRMSEKSASPYAEFFYAIYHDCEITGETDFYSAWEKQTEVLAGALKLKKKDAQMLKRIFCVTQNTDLQTQKSAILIAKDEIDCECERLRKDKEGKGKVALCLGAAGGMALFILFV